MIPAFNVGAGMASGGGPLEFTYIGGERSTSSTVNWPGGIQAGDIAYLLVMAKNSDEDSYPGASVPSGFTQVATGTSGGSGSGYKARTSHFYKVLNGTETGTFTHFSGQNGKEHTLVVLRPSAGWAFLAQREDTFSYSSSSLSRTITTAARPILCICLSSSTASSTLSGPTVDGSGAFTSGSYAWALYEDGDPSTTAVWAGSSGRRSIAVFEYE